MSKKSISMERDINRDHFCPKCGERMRKIDDNSGLWVKCPRATCGFDYHIFHRVPVVKHQDLPTQLSMFTHENDGLPF